MLPLKLLEELVKIVVQITICNIEVVSNFNIQVITSVQVLNMQIINFGVNGLRSIKGGL